MGWGIKIKKPKIGGTLGKAAEGVKSVVTGRPTGQQKDLAKTVKKAAKGTQKVVDNNPAVAEKLAKSAQINNWNPMDPQNIPKYESVVETKNGINGPVDVLRGGWGMGNNDAWKGAQQKKIDLQQYQAMDMAKQQGLSNQRQAFGQLAMRGGLSGGAGASMMKQNMRDINLAQQGVLSNSNLNRLDVDSKAADMDRDNRRMDIETMMRDKELSTGSKGNVYDTQAKAWAANKAGNAIANSKPQPGFLDRTWDMFEKPFK